MPVIIMRGLPGSGKTTKARDIHETWTDGPSLIVSADDYFTCSKCTHYDFKPEIIGQAHTDCFRKALMFLQEYQKEQLPLLIIDNTNIRAWEFQPYVALAGAFRQGVRTMLVECPIDVSIERNTHGVPPEIVEKMSEAFEPPTPGLAQEVIPYVPSE